MTARGACRHHIFIPVKISVMNASTVSTLFVLFGFLLPAVLASVSCKDSDGNEVDWYFMYKTPEVSSGKGYGFVYYDSNGRTENGDLGNNNTALKNTIYQLGLYGHTVDKSRVGWVIWNDQTYVDIKQKVVNHEQDPNGKYYAHSKVSTLTSSLHLLATTCSYMSLGSHWI